MGMFDYVTCEYPLIDYPEFQNRRFQTKSLERCLFSYKITEKGELIRLALPGDILWDGQSEKDKREKFTGILCFYTFADDTDEYLVSGRQSGWIEYNAFLMEGWVQTILLSKYEKPNVIEGPKTTRED